MRLTALGAKEDVLLDSRFRPTQNARNGKVRRRPGALLRGRGDPRRLPRAAAIIVDRLQAGVARDAGRGDAVHQSESVRFGGGRPAGGLGAGHHVHLDITHIRL